MSTSKTFTVSDYILTRLYELGLRKLYAVPGDYAAPFLNALDDFEGIERIANINELGSGYAADGYARFTGIGAACVQYGVGTFSMLNATAGSYVERVPVVAITGSPTRENRKVTRQEGVLFHHSTGNLKADQEIFKHVTVDSIIINNAKNAPKVLDEAFTAMITFKRPIYIEVWQNVWTLPCEPPVGTLSPKDIKSEQLSLAAAVETAWQRISKAKLPVIWAGVEIQRYGLQSLLQQLVDSSGFPFTTTSLGKTILDESQEQFIGTYAGPASLAETREVMEKADCIIALGDVITDDYLDIMGNDFGKIISSSDQDMRVGYQYFKRVTMKAFIESLVGRMLADNSYPKKIKIPKITIPTPKFKNSDQLTYNIFFDVLMDFIRKEEMLSEIELILGESTSLYVAGNIMGMPENSFVGQAAWGSLGHETGCALGVAQGSGKRPVVVAGDGGFHMICQELSPLSTYNVNAMVFVMSNYGYAIEQAFVNLDAFTPEGSFAPYDILPKWDYKALAKAYHVEGYQVKTVGELKDLLKKLKNGEKPALIEVQIPEKDLAPQLKRLATIS